MQYQPSVSIYSATSSDLLEQIAEHYGLAVHKDCQRREIILPDAIAKEGKIISYSPGTGIDTLIIKAKFRAPFSIEAKGDFPAPLIFFTQSKGATHVKSSRQEFSVSQLQCSIYAGFTDDVHTYTFDKDEPTICMITMIHKKKFFENIECEVLEIPDDLLSTIEGMANREDSFLFQEIFHLPAIDALQEIIKQDNIGLLNSSFATAKIYEIIFLQLQQYVTTSTNDRHRHKVRERNKLSIIQNAESILMTNLVDPPTIPELARMVGTNQQDLKNGFRQVYGTTINQYMTDQRLEQAGILITGGKMTVSEIAKAVGYNSAGYFSRRFKEKYGMPPKKFTQEMRNRTNGKHSSVSGVYQTSNP